MNVEKYIPLASKLAKQYSKKSRCEYDDLFQVAMIGVWKALQKENKEKGNIDAYVSFYARGGILQYLVRKQDLIKVPRQIVDLAVKIKKRQLEEKLPKEIAEILNEPQHFVKDALDHLKNSVISLDIEIGEETTLADHVGYFEDKEIFIDYNNFLNILNEKEKMVFIQVQQGYSQIEIARHLNISQMTISRCWRQVKKQFIEYMEVAV